MTIHDVIDDAMCMVIDHIDDNWTPITSEVFAKMGFDPRAFSRCMFYSAEGIAVKGNTSSIDYYGGFEYVKGEDRTTMFNITIYSIESSRVRDHVCRVIDEKVAKNIRQWYGEYDEYYPEGEE